MRPLRPGLTGLVLALGATLQLSAPLLAQRDADKRLPRWAIDRYTDKNDPEILKKVGYVSYGPFSFGEDTTTDQISKALGEAKICWVETAHFKLGLELSDWAVPMDKKLKARIADELQELEDRGFVRIPKRPRVLDSWLRVHLMAQRLENLYTEFSEKLGVKPEDFPTKRAVFVNNKYMGEGPYLGQPEKYTILVTRRLSDYSRYLQLYIGTVQEMAKRHNFKTVGSQFLGTSEEIDGARLRNDVAMHVHLVWNTVHNLINGFRFYTHDLPVWWTEGNAHWFAHRISEDWPNFDQNESSIANMGSGKDWNVKTRQLVDRGKHTPIAEILNWRDFGQLKFDDHVLSWSLVDFVMHKYGDKGWRDYMFEMHEILDPKTGENLAKDIPGLQREAMRKAWDTHALKFAEEWKEYVLSTYPVK